MLCTKLFQLKRNSRFCLHNNLAFKNEKRMEIKTWTFCVFIYVFFVFFQQFCFYVFYLFFSPFQLFMYVRTSPFNICKTTRLLQLYHDLAAEMHENRFDAFETIWKQKKLQINQSFHELYSILLNFTSL